MIPARISLALARLSASVQAAAPVTQATPLLKAALVRAGQALVADIDETITASAGALDGEDPVGFAGSYVDALNGLATASGDQAALVDMRGTIGRAVFNLAQA